MTQLDLSAIGREAVMLALTIAAPILGIAIAVGLIISILQAATQVHEQTLAFVPKVVAMALVLLWLGGWMMDRLMDFFVRLMQSIGSLV